MKKFLIIVLSLMLLLPLAASADKLDDIKSSGKLLVGASADFPPFEFWYTDPATGEETLQGIDMALAKGLAENLGVEFVLVDQAFSGLITELRAGSIDIILSGMNIKPDRMEVVDFSVPYFSGTQVMVVKKDELDMYKAVETMAGKTIGVQLGTLQQEIAETQFTDSEMLALDKIPLLVLELEMGNIDGLLLDNTVAFSYASVHPKIAVSEMPIAWEFDGMGAAINKGEDNATFLKAVNEYIEMIMADGTLDAWTQEAYEINGVLLQQADE